MNWSAMTERLTISQAAVHLGLSPQTVRRRIRAGTLPAEKASTPHGSTWFVLLTDEPLNPPRVTPPDGASHVLTNASQELVRLRERLEDVTAERDRAVTREVWYQQQIADLTHQAENHQVL